MAPQKSDLHETLATTDAVGTNIAKLLTAIIQGAQTYYTNRGTMKNQSTSVEELLSRQRGQILSGWQAELKAGSNGRDLASEAQATGDLLDAVLAALRARGSIDSFDDKAWEPVRQFLASLSRSRAAQGSSAADTSRFVLALKKPIFSAMQDVLAADPAVLVATVWTVSTLIDQMAQFTVTTYQTSREDIIKRQQEELLELSTPVIKLWDGILAAPMIGTLDSGRTQIVMEALLQRIVDTGSSIAIIDITGVPTVDTLVAQHLMKTVTAIRLMGAECIISGIRPQIAQTIVHLGIDLQGIQTKATLADALAVALKRSGFSVSRARSSGQSADAASGPVAG